MRKNYSYLLTFLYLANFIYTNPSGQWKQIIYTDGISSNYIFDVEKDNKERIWIGTQNGVTLIDGASIKKFGASNGLPAANIIKIVSANNVIYAATSNKGIYYLDKGEMFQKSSIVKGSKLYTMEKVDSKLFVSTNLENILFDGEEINL